MLRNLLWKLARLVLFAWDAEKAHRLTIASIRVLPGPVLRLASGTSFAESRGLIPDAPPVTVLGLGFQSRVGLAAGFDKDCEVLHALPDLGFGFAEIGTLTPRPQPGNPKPRLFREPARDALFNRMGFNNEGAAHAARRLEAIRPGLPPHFRVGVNVGKNKDTPLEEAHRDYERALEPFEGLADYVVINVSSPNTPGLRSLQTAESLRPIVEAARNRIESWKRRPPLLLKLAPELTQGALVELVPFAEGWGIDGWVLTNTLGGAWKDGVAGGWSGLPVQSASREALVRMRALSSRPIISVGGILSEEEARERIRLGAALIQVYSGWVLRGPGLPSRLARGIRG